MSNLREPDYVFRVFADGQVSSLPVLYPSLNNALGDYLRSKMVHRGDWRISYRIRVFMKPGK